MYSINQCEDCILLATFDLDSLRVLAHAIASRLQFGEILTAAEKANLIELGTDYDLRVNQSLVRDIL